MNDAYHNPSAKAESAFTAPICMVIGGFRPRSPTQLAADPALPHVHTACTPHTSRRSLVSTRSGTERRAIWEERKRDAGQATTPGLRTKGAQAYVLSETLRSTNKTFQESRYVRGHQDVHDAPHDSMLLQLPHPCRTHHSVASSQPHLLATFARSFSKRVRDGAPSSSTVPIHIASTVRAACPLPNLPQDVAPAPAERVHAPPGFSARLSPQPPCTLPLPSTPRRGPGFPSPPPAPPPPLLLLEATASTSCSRHVQNTAPEPATAPPHRRRSAHRPQPPALRAVVSSPRLFTRLYHRQARHSLLLAIRALHSAPPACLRAFGRYSRRLASALRHDKQGTPSASPPPPLHQRLGRVEAGEGTYAGAP
ncbi:hypothetical protein C8R45DRAFT_1094527 [Mycena sanguinolenta]|nr:hypothetical protein C8R45DRAFT_1094527 [Mycena sanguinolenta]